ncbi:MAG: Lrp/AsnC family transcriptional regulator [Candidatus Micrarchaeota archaeon]|nr:Lrp/AsnC family transcriptional regulator [Candidatus Micrarchaeota archaeon]
MGAETFKLDQYDRKLLYELDLDSSLPLFALAKRLRKSKQFVLFRQKRLEDAGVITGYPAIVDMGSLGYFSFRIYLKFRQTTAKEAQKVVEFIKGLPNVWTITLLHGKWDLAIFVGAKNTQDVHAIWDPIMDKYKGKVAAYNFALYAPIYNFNRTFFMKGDEKVETRKYGEGKPFQADAVDWEIIHAYAPNARQSVLEVARKTGHSPEAVRRRIVRLEKGGVICGYKLGLDIDRLGYTSYRMDIELLSNARNDELFEYCRQHRNIYQVQHTVGHMDFETEVVVEGLPQLLSIIEAIKERFSNVVGNVEYFSYSTYHLLNYIPD